MKSTDPLPSQKRRVLVTGAGIVSPLGRGLTQTADALFENPTYQGREVDRFDVSQTRCKTAAQVCPTSLSDLPVHSRRSLHLASLMMMAAMREAMDQATSAACPTFCVIGTTSGAMTNGEAFFRQLPGTSRHARPLQAANYMPHKPVHDALEMCGLRMPVRLVANACASGANAIGLGWQMIRAGLADCVITGGYDALSELVFVGFDSLQAATPEICRPFDLGRSGLILGEAAAVLVLESADHAAARGACPLVELAGYGITTDNHHLTQPHPSGVAVEAAMRQALKAADADVDAVDYINAHGTATAFNDSTEAAAIHSLGRRGIPVSSTKSLIGHTLGAAGAVEALFSLLAIQRQILPPNLNYRSMDPAWDLDLVTSPRPTRVRGVLSNSLGFGGTNASLFLREAA